MATNLAHNLFNSIFFNANDRIPIQISLSYVSMSLIDNNSAFIEVMAWRQTGSLIWNNVNLIHENE